MKSNRFLVKYKHNIVGQLKDINSVIGPLDNDKECSSTYFVPFSIIHSTLIRMISTSRETIKELFPQASVLNVLRELPNKNSLKQMNVDGLEVYYENSSDEWKGYLVVQGDDEIEIIFTLGKISALLQTTKIDFDLNNLDLESKLRRLTEK